MKKLFGFLLVLFVFINVTAAADHHFEIKCRFSGSLEGRTETLDFYECEDMITAVSSLFPDYALQTDQCKDFSSGISMLLSMCPETASEIVRTADRCFIAFLEQKSGDILPGTYTGLLFDYASNVRLAEFCLSDLTGYFREYLPVQNQEHAAGMFLQWILDLCSEKQSNDDLLFSVQSFDSGKYLTIQIIRDHFAVMTISEDRTKDNIFHFVVSYRENNQYYFREMSFRCDPESFLLQTSFRYADDSSYYNAYKKSPVLSDCLSLMNNQNNQLQFQYEMISEKLTDSLIVTGTSDLPDDQPARLNARIRIGGLTGEEMIINMVSESVSRSVSFSDKTIIHSDNETETAGLSMAVMTNVALLTAELLPALPEEYQTLLIKLLYAN